MFSTKTSLKIYSVKNSLFKYNFKTFKSEVELSFRHEVPCNFETLALNMYLLKW